MCVSLPVSINFVATVHSMDQCTDLGWLVTEDKRAYRTAVNVVQAWNAAVLVSAASCATLQMAGDAFSLYMWLISCLTVDCSFGKRR